MAYFIGNGSMKIGGGSLGRTEELPSLKLLCVDLCARHLDRLSNLGDMPVEVFIDLLKRAKAKATPQVVRRLQDQNKRLVCEEVDLAFWKIAVEDHILRRSVPAPGPDLVDRVNEHGERLSSLQAKVPQEPSKEWCRDIVAVLKALDEVPASVGVLRETLIGKTVGPLRKNADEEVSRLATAIVRRWKEAARARGPDDPVPPPSSSQSPSPKSVAGPNGRASREAARGGTGKKGSGSAGSGDAAAAVERSPAEEKQRTVEEGFRCKTWNELYQHLEKLREDKVRASSKRAREAREREQQKKPKMMVGNSKGVDPFGNGVRPLTGSRGGSNNASRGFNLPSPPKKRKRGGEDEITSVSELRSRVVMGQRLSSPMQSGRRPGGEGASSRAPPKKSFWSSK